MLFPGHRGSALLRRPRQSDRDRSGRWDFGGWMARPRSADPDRTLSDPCQGRRAREPGRPGGRSEPPLGPRAQGRARSLATGDARHRGSREARVPPDLPDAEPDRPIGALQVPASGARGVPVSRRLAPDARRDLGRRPPLDGPPRRQRCQHRPREARDGRRASGWPAHRPGGRPFQAIHEGSGLIEGVRTGLRIGVEAWARRFRTRSSDKVTAATFTFVAIDDDGKPRPVSEG